MADTNKIQYGLKNVYYSVMTNETTWEAPKAWKGAKSLSLSPEGDTSVYYADDMAYFSQDSNNGYTGDLEMTYLSDDVLKDIYGYVETEDGMLVEDANAKPKTIALLFEFNGDVNAVRNILYRVVLGRPETEAKTREDSIEPDTTKIGVTVLSVEDGENQWVKAKCPKGSSGYEAFFTTAPKKPKKKVAM